MLDLLFLDDVLLADRLYRVQLIVVFLLTQHHLSVRIKREREHIKKEGVQA